MMKTLLAVVASAVMLLGAGDAIAAHPQYDVVDLGVLAGTTNSRGWDVNTAGTVVGGSYNNSGPFRAFRWPGASPMVDLGTLGGADAEANGINANGHIVGSALTSSGANHAFLLRDGSSTMLDLDPASSWAVSVAQDVSDGGVSSSWPDIVGSYTEDVFRPWKAFIGRAICVPGPCSYVLLDLAEVTGSTYFSAYAEAINAVGKVTGWVEGDGVDRRAFVFGGFSSPTLVSLPPLPGGAWSEGNDINDSNDVVGSSMDYTYTWTAVLWRGGTGSAVTIGTLRGSAEALGINNAGRVVGDSWDPSGAQSAFVYTDADGMADLNALIPAGSGWVLGYASAINESGQITGEGTIGGQVHAFLLSPVPPTTTTTSTSTSSTTSTSSSSTTSTSSSLPPPCGNGVPNAGEECDDGVLNGTASSCCTSTCRILADGSACNDDDVCTGPDFCRAGSCQDHFPILCTDGDACTRDDCDPAAGCSTQPIAGCDPTGSTEALVGGPDMLCSGGTLEVATNTCVLSTPSVDLRIPLDGPDYAFPTPRTVTVAALPGQADCSSSTFAIGGSDTPSDVRTVSCVDLFPAGQCFAPGTGVTLRFKWQQDPGPGCSVAGAPGISEGDLRVYDENLVPVTANCGNFSADPVCPPESEITYPGCGASSSTSCPGAFCAEAVCRPNDTPGVYEVRDVRHFSRHGLGVACYYTDKPKLTITKVTESAGMQALIFTGTARRQPGAALNPAADGLGVRIFDVASALLDEFVPPGPGWTGNTAGTKWVYRSEAATGLTKVKVINRGGDSNQFVRFKMKGSGLALVPATPYAEGQILFPSGGDCYSTEFPGVPPAPGLTAPTCTIKGSSLKCK